MALSGDEQDGIGVALNEAAWLGMTVDERVREVQLGFQVMALSADAANPDSDRVVTIVLSGVTRIAASLRTVPWDNENDENAKAIPLTLASLPAVVDGFGGKPIYGWRFIDRPDDAWDSWRDRLSLDVTVSPTEAVHVIDLFQERDAKTSRTLDMRVWFERLEVFDVDGTAIELNEFIAAGVRWWDGFSARDPRTQGSGIVPGGPEPQTQANPDAGG